MILVTRAVLFVVHSVAHVCFYVLPRTLFYALVEAPLTLIEQAIGDQRTFDGKDNLMTVVTNWWDKSTLHAFGLVEEGMTYPCPLYNGHMQTLLGAVRQVPRVAYRRVMMAAEDTCPICLDWSLAVPLQQQGGGELQGGGGVKGVLLLIPGLASSSSSSYIRQFVRYANQNGFHCCVLNARGMGDTPVTTRRLMSAVFTDDLRTVLRNKRLLVEAADASILPHTSFSIQAVGFSLGGAILGNYLCEEGAGAAAAKTATTTTMLKSAFSICTPWDMHESAMHMLRPAQQLIYQRTLTAGLVNYVRRHRHVVEALPEIDASRLLGVEDGISRIRTVQEFDALLVAPHFGFTCREDYYSAGSTIGEKMTRVDVPFLCIGAQDDPITGPPPSLRRWERVAQLNKNVLFVGMPAGGHLGFVGNPFEELLQSAEASHQLVVHAATSILAMH